MREPTFVIAGAQRCGTTTLYHLLDEHPDVFLAKPLRPEPKYFLEEPRPGRDRDWYLRTWFAGAGTAVAVGEKSTSYFEVEAAPARMKRQFPQLRAVLMFRNPIDRAISNYRMSRRHGLETESLEFALRNEPRRLRETAFPEISVHPFAYLERGRYADKLEGFLKVFRRDELHLILLDDLESNPERVCSDLFAFLGVRPDFRPQGLRSIHNAAAPADLRLTADLFEELRAAFQESNRRLEKLLSRDLSRWDTPSTAVRRILV